MVQTGGSGSCFFHFPKKGKDVKEDALVFVYR